MPGDIFLTIFHRLQQSPRPVDHCLNEAFDNSIALGTIEGTSEIQHQLTPCHALQFWGVIILETFLRHNSRNAVPLRLAAFGPIGDTCEMQHQFTRRRILEFWRIIVVKSDLRNNLRNAFGSTE